MTWSIVARDPASGAFGVAVTTKFFAVGALCPHAGSGVGALATQALINPTFGPRGLRLLREGVPAAVIVETLLAADQGRETRQLHVLDAAGRNAAHTGRDCVGWCGHLLRAGFSVAGNMLAGPRVVEDTATAYEVSGHLPFAERLISALDAGQAAGGDKRGKQSAALRIYAGEEYPWLDMRVDDHAEPLAELRRLYEEARRMFLTFARFLPTKSDPSGIYDRATINAELARVQEAMNTCTPMTVAAALSDPRPAAAAETRPLLEVRDLRTYFGVDGGELRAVDGVSFSVAPGRTLGIVGESGCGKSMTALSIMGLIPQPPGRIAGGEICFDGVDLLKLKPAELRERRGNQISMIFQEPMTSLNPAFTVGDQIVEGILRHRPVTKQQAREHAIEMLRRVRIPSPERRIDEYPHKLSGGMRQRVMIAMALACDPKLLIADEPTTALDVTIQAQILELMRQLRDETGAAILIITHDLGVIAEIAHEVIVMYAGKVVERAEVADLFREPQHPYTIGLLGSIPKLTEAQPRLTTIEGMVPNPLAMPEGCRFHPRCPFAVEQCRAAEPPLREIKPGQFAACWRAPLGDGGA